MTTGRMASAVSERPNGESGCTCVCCLGHDDWQGSRLMNFGRLSQLVRVLVQQTAKSTGNSRWLRRMFSLAQQDGLVTNRAYFPMLRENDVHTGFFERERCREVKGYLPAELRPVVTFAYFTGWRIQSEILSLEWRQVDMTACVVSLDGGKTKHGQGRVLPFAQLEELRSVLEAQDELRKELTRRGIIYRWVFHREGKAIRSFRVAWEGGLRQGWLSGVHPSRSTSHRRSELRGGRCATQCRDADHRSPDRVRLPALRYR